MLLNQREVRFPGRNIGRVLFAAQSKHLLKKERDQFSKIRTEQVCAINILP